MTPAPPAAVVDLDWSTASAFLEWHWLFITVPNLIVVLLLVAAIVLAIALPIPTRMVDR